MTISKTLDSAANVEQTTNQSTPALNTLSARVRYALERKRMRQIDLARDIGVKHQVIGYLCNSETRKSRFTPRIADALGINLEWLEKGTGAFETIQSAYNPQESRIPILNSNTLQNFLTHGPNNIASVKTVVTTQGNPDTCFAYPAEDQAMLPRIAQGDLLIIDTSKQPQEGDIAFIKVGDTGERTCRYFQQHGDTISLIPQNTKSYLPITPTDKDQIVGTVIENRWFR